VSDSIAAPFLEEGDRVFLDGHTFGGHPVSCAVALANIDIIEREDLCGNVLRHEALFDDVMASLGELPIVGDVRGCGYFRVAELVRDSETGETFTDEESEWLLRKVVSPMIYDAGLICRADDRADPVIVLSPTLICGEQELEFIRSTLTTVFTEAWRQFQNR
jgi:adenosylmethionine-8-amino-7-oxononanoate aminotransferase